MITLSIDLMLSHKNGDNHSICNRGDDKRAAIKLKNPSFQWSSTSASLIFKRKNVRRENFPLCLCYVDYTLDAQCTSDPHKSKKKSPYLHHIGHRPPLRCFPLSDQVKLLNVHIFHINIETFETTSHTLLPNLRSTRMKKYSKSAKRINPMLIRIQTMRGQILFE